VDSFAVICHSEQSGTETLR